MSSIIYLLADLFPFWAIPLSAILFELGRFYGRHRMKPRMAFLMLTSLTLFMLSICYIVFDGRSNLQPAMQNFEKVYLR